MARYSRDGIDWIITDDAAYKALRQMVRNVDDFRPYWPEIEDAIREDEALRFSTQDGGTWKPLTKKYAKWKAAHLGGKILQLSGSLMASLTEKGAEGQKVTRGKTQMLFRTQYGKPGIALASHQNRKRRLINERSPFLRKRMGDAAQNVALQWKRQWDGGG